jgi:peptidoglycan/LPS O-acetylase OafA/YrhL
MQPKDKRRRFHTIEGMRGAGAGLIVIRHAPIFFSGVQVPESFLAVDLFYLVSGFVIAHAYGQRLEAGEPLGRFMAARLVRLYPLYLVGLLVGIAPASIATITDPHGWWNPLRLCEAITTGLVMIPFVPGLRANGSSLDGPTWTLLPELIANLVYAAAGRVLNTVGLMALILVSGAGVVFGALRFQTLDIGYNQTDQWAALARVGFSFFAGVLIFRLSNPVERRSWTIAWACVAAVAGVLAFRPSADFAPIFELVAVLAGFPLLLIVASRYEPGPRVGRAFGFIGLMSYAVYILHQPLAVLARQLFARLNWAPPVCTGWLMGPAFLVGLVVFAWQLDKHYDAPIRRWLRTRFQLG